VQDKKTRLRSVRERVLNQQACELLRAGAGRRLLRSYTLVNVISCVWPIRRSRRGLSC
jgi:hypothetical protein